MFLVLLILPASKFLVPPYLRHTVTQSDSRISTWPTVEGKLAATRIGGDGNGTERCSGWRDED